MEFERRRERLSDEIAAILVDEIPGYAALSSPNFDADLRRNIGEHQDALAAHIRRGRSLQPADVEYVRRSATARARAGLPIADYLRALRLGQRRLWEELLTIAGSRSARFVADATRNVMDYIDFAAVVASEAYLQEQQALVADADRVRRDLLEELLLGREPSPGPDRTVARAAGLHASARCLLILAVVDGTDLQERALRSTASILEHAITPRVRPLVVVRQHEIIIVASVPSEPPPLTKPLQRALRRLRSEGAQVTIGVSTVQDSPAGLPAAYAEATAAVDAARRRDGVLALADLRSFAYLTLHPDDTVHRLVRPAIREFAREDADTGGVYAATLRAYVAADLSTKGAAERLHLHVNTAHYRLGRIAEKTGCDLRNLDDIVDLLVAIEHAAR
jgi:sugar diacid utilization regulator